MNETKFVKEIREYSKNLPEGFIKKVVVSDSLDSTNSTAKQLAMAGAEEGTLVIAREQHQGRGRFDRVWQSPEGGMYLSLILRPSISPEKLSLLPFIAGLAVVKAMDSFGLHTTIKWPNDVLANGKKIAGILLESEGVGRTIQYVVAGIGINLNTNLRTLSPDIQPRSTSLLHEKGASVDYLEFLKMILIQFEVFYVLLIHHQYERIIDEWKMHSDTLGKPVRVKTSTEIVQGVAVDVDPSGFLLLRTKGGETKKVYSGDCLYINELDHT